MNWFTSLTTGLKSLFQKQRVERELDEELDGYLEASAAHKQRAGMNLDAARRAARVEIGSRNSVKHQVWSSRWESALEGLLQDIRISVRMLTKSSGFTIIALLSLALGIGANTAIFTLLNQVLLRNLPVQHPEELVTFGKSQGAGIMGGIDLGFNDMFTWDFDRQLEANPGPFQSAAGYGSFSDRVSVRPPNGPSSSAPAIQARASLVTGNYFSTLGATPLLGRTILPYDADAPLRNPVVVLSQHFWQQTLSADPTILNQSITINGNLFRVIGVMPQAFYGIRHEPRPVDLWVPFTMQPQILPGLEMFKPRDIYHLHMFARLKTGYITPAGLKQAQLWLDRQIRDYIRAGEGAVIAPERQQEIERATVPLIPGAHGVSLLGRVYGDSLRILMIVVALVLLISCANLANFLLARSAAREREIATRLALGCSRARVLRQSLVETTLLSLSGGALGLALAFAATRALIAFVTLGVAYTALSPAPDLTVLLFTLGVSLLTGLLFGIAPALSAARTGTSTSLSSNARSSTPSRAARVFPRILITSQIMLSLLLLIGAGLFLRTLRNLQDQDFGFERTHLLLAQFDPQITGYKPSQIPALNSTLLERLESLPGVRSAALAETPPISASSWVTSFRIAGYVLKPKEGNSSTFNRVSGHYFETTGISIVAGRAITPGDSATSLKVAVVSESLARHFFPAGNALGHSFTVEDDDATGPWQIVGIARDTHFGNPRDTKLGYMIYLPLAQLTGPNNNEAFAHTIEIRTAGNPAKTIADLRHAIAEIDPNLPVLQIQTIHEQVSSLMSDEELISSLTGIFSLIALLLAAIGLYGVLSYSVVRRTGEIGIRLALGAQIRTVLWMILRESLLLLAIGVGLGLPITLAATRVIKEQLFGLSAVDPMSFAVAIIVVSGMTVLAAWLPARRAAKVDPMTALRCD